MDLPQNLSASNQTPEGGDLKEAVRRAAIAPDALVLTRYLPLVAAEPAPSRLVLTLDDVLPRIPTHCLKPGLHNPDRELHFPLDELSAGIARGRVTVNLSSLASRYPDVFAAPKTLAEDIPVFLPLQKLMLQIGRITPAPAARPSVAAPPAPKPPSTPAPEPAARAEPHPPAPLAAAPAPVAVVAPTTAPPSAVQPPPPPPAVAVAEPPPAVTVAAQPVAGAPPEDLSPARLPGADPISPAPEQVPASEPERTRDDALDREASASLVEAAAAELSPSLIPSTPPPPEAAAAPAVSEPPIPEPPSRPEPLTTPSTQTQPIQPAPSSASSLLTVDVAESSPPRAAPTADAGVIPARPTLQPAPVPAQAELKPVSLKIAAGLPHVRPPLLTRFGPQLTPREPREPAPEPTPPASIPRPVFAASAPEHKPVEPEPNPVPGVQPPPLFAARPPEGSGVTAAALDSSAPPDPTPPSPPPTMEAVLSPPPTPPAPVPPPKAAATFPRAHDASLLKFEQEPLQAIFMTDETLDLAKISDLSSQLPGLSGCMLVVGETVASGGDRPDGLDGKTLRELSRQLTTTVGAFSERLPADPTFTLYGGNRALTIFSRDQFCLCVVHQTRGFMPGVRERLTAVADSLARTLPALSA